MRLRMGRCRCRKRSRRESDTKLGVCPQAVRSDGKHGRPSLTCEIGLEVPPLISGEVAVGSDNPPFAIIRACGTQECPGPGPNYASTYTTPLRRVNAVGTQVVPGVGLVKHDAAGILSGHGLPTIAYDRVLEVALERHQRAIRCCLGWGAAELAQGALDAAPERVGNVASVHGLSPWRAANRRWISAMRPRRRSKGVSPTAGQDPSSQPAQKASPHAQPRYVYRRSVTDHLPVHARRHPGLRSARRRSLPIRPCRGDIRRSAPGTVA